MTGACRFCWPSSAGVSSTIRPAVRREVISVLIAIVDHERV
ncbi:hypothetical protein ACCUM_2076 [Candidatus Accumulibacter phosphatis]|uniref:Uncharacterized protein n=1 Tax=Candidatus Accumulibacter phosphatis TaxID=327160 RepID=A0A5S4EI77_9PROT|nr:hypothetical protein ACCUM_2076 [Candidatus Accumulibacter phosphatis]